MEISSQAAHGWYDPTPNDSWSLGHCFGLSDHPGELPLALKASSWAACNDEKGWLQLTLLAVILRWLQPRHKRCCSRHIHMWTKKVGERKNKILQEEAFRSTKFCRNWRLIFTSEERWLWIICCTQMCVCCIWNTTGSPSAESSEAELCTTWKPANASTVCNENGSVVPSFLQQMKEPALSFPGTAWMQIHKYG